LSAPPKADFVPEGIDVDKSRRAYIAAVREQIYKRRSEKLKEFMKATHPEQVDYQ